MSSLRRLFVVVGLLLVDDAETDPLAGDKLVLLLEVDLRRIDFIELVWAVIYGHILIYGLFVLYVEPKKCCPYLSDTCMHF
jgi:hypothetical protein